MMSGTNSNKKFTIIIPSWNNADYLKLCIDSIRKNSTHQHQLIVFVNEGIDGTLDWVKQQSDVEYIFSPVNKGICYALNESAKLATTNYITYLNDDMYVCKGWDEALVKEINSIGHDNFYLSGTLIEPYNTHNPCVIVADYGKSLELFDEQKLIASFHSHQKNNWSGATWPPSVVHKKNWDIVAGLSMEFSPGMYSDPDFSMKLWQKGIRTFIGVEQSRVYHFISKSTGRMKQKSYGSEIFLIKWGMTARTFYKYYLRLGHTAMITLPQPKLPLMIRLKNYGKRWWILIRHGNLYQQALMNQATK